MGLVKVEVIMNQIKLDELMSHGRKQKLSKMDSQKKIFRQNGLKSDSRLENQNL